MDSFLKVLSVSAFLSCQVFKLEIPQAKSLGTPGVDETTESATSGTEESKSLPLAPEKASLYRAITTRANHIAQDRADVQYIRGEGTLPENE